MTKASTATKNEKNTKRNCACKRFEEFVGLLGWWLPGEIEPTRGGLIYNWFQGISSTSIIRDFWRSCPCQCLPKQEQLQLALAFVILFAYPSFCVPMGPSMNQSTWSAFVCLRRPVFQGSSLAILSSIHPSTWTSTLALSPSELWRYCHSKPEWLTGLTQYDHLSLYFYWSTQLLVYVSLSIT